ncbi:ubiquitin-like protein-specific protease [Mactra antiquata]
MAGVFGNLFEDDNFENFTENVSSKKGIPSPPRTRGQCQLSGIDNQGATCYLNSLLQTLLLTPEFRDGLFCLTQDELGKLEDADKPASKVRVIPIQLQRLFANLLLKNCQSVSTRDLTNSFGWTNDEQFQQHDVQELNRILFSAIESSLVGTSGSDLIKHLYKGKIVNQIRCTQCGKISEREEDFLDISVTVAGSSSVEQSLSCAYLDKEMLDGKNQYRCEGCNKLVDAEKGAKLRSLPSILTLSLLRFSFDYQKLERFKETGRFSFPQSINMKPFCDNVSGEESLDYELFSVVIHMGGAHGGHYHAYIKDIDNLGHWVTPEEEEIVIPTDPVTGAIDFIECDSPIELVQVILAREKNKEMSIDKLGQEILKQTGLSWNKRFKGRYGPITKFLNKYNDKFIFDPVNKHVTLKIHNGPNFCQDNQSKSESLSKPAQCKCTKTEKMASSQGQGHNVNICEKCKKDSDNRTQAKGDNNSPQKTNSTGTGQPHVGQAWFDFNDSRVHPMYEKSIEKQYSGKESAYMLFYRRKTLVRPNKALGNKVYCMPEHLITEVMKENSILDLEREEYDREVNKLTLQVHFSCCYQYREGALKCKSGMTEWIEVCIDQRQTTDELYQAVRELGKDYLPCDDVILSRYKELVSGGHIYDNVQESKELLIKHYDLNDGAKLFFWNGNTVNEDVIPVGIDREPVYITVIYGDGLQFSQGYSKSLTLSEMKVIICYVIRIQPEHLCLKRVFGKDSEVRMVPISASEESLTLTELKLHDGDQLLAEDTTEKGAGLSEESVSSTIYSSKFMIQVENRCNNSINNVDEYVKIKVEVDRQITVCELKSIVMTKFGLETIQDGGRLRIDHDSLGLRHPIHEELSIFEAGITQGSHLVLEPGPAPKSDEITLSFTCESSSSGPDYSEVIVKQSSTVNYCLQCILNRANITDGDWYLRKTNWCGEAADILDDVDVTLDQCNINDGDVLLLVRGRLPPKGFIQLPIWLHSTPQSVKAGNQQDGGLLSWVSNFFGGYYNDPGSPVRTDEVNAQCQPVNVGSVEISRESTLVDLKEMIMTLIGELPIPSVDFMRLRLKEKDKLTTILRDNRQSLKRLNLTSNSVLALQILPEEETLRNDQIVLDICQRIPDTKQYSQPIELIWNTANGATLHSLKQAISKVLYTETEHLCLAKHFPLRYEWMVIEKHDNTGHQKGKKKGQWKNNIRQAPFNIRDGDTIGVKDTQYDPNNIDNFMTEEDEIGQIALQQEIEEKRKMREERKKYDSIVGGGDNKKRREVGISIKVGDFG